MFPFLQFDLPDASTVKLEARRALAVGAAARDREQALQHVERMRQRGVMPPPHVPMLHPLMPGLLTNDTDIAVIGPHTTPEVEVVVFHTRGAGYVTVGSDHTDRRIEADFALRGKNACPKVVGRSAWPLAAVRDHWDELVLSCRCAGVRVQDASVAQIMHVDALLAFVAAHDGPGHDGRLVFSGTVPMLTEPPADAAVIEVALFDPVRRMRLAHTYTVHVLDEIFPYAS